MSLRCSILPTRSERRVEAIDIVGHRLAGLRAELGGGVVYSPVGDRVEISVERQVRGLVLVEPARDATDTGEHDSHNREPLELTRAPVVGRPAHDYPLWTPPQRPIPNCRNLAAAAFGAAHRGGAERSVRAITLGLVRSHNREGPRRERGPREESPLALNLIGRRGRSDRPRAAQST